MLALMTGKIVFILLAFLVTLLCALLPYAIAKFLSGRETRLSKRRQLVETVVNCFSAGVFLGTAFLHLIPESSEHFEQVREHGYVLELAVNHSSTETSTEEPHNHHHDESEHHHGFPLGFLVILCGFFLVYLLETTLDMVVSTCQRLRSESKMQVDPERPRSQSKVAPMETSHLEPPTGHCDPRSRATLFDAATLVMALSIHSVLEGITIGISLTKTAFTARVISISIHKVFVSMVTGSQVSRACGNRLCLLLTLLSVFAMSTPLGTSIGTILTESDVSVLMMPTNQMIIVVLEAISAGMFVYIAFFELLMKEQGHGAAWGVIQSLSCAAGAGAITCLMALCHE